MLRITDTLAIDDDELEESFIRSSGPGGQNVNKVASAVELRFDVRRSRSLPDGIAVRLMRLAGQRLTKEGVIVIRADTHRTQDRNREEARSRLAALVREASVPPKRRVATKPTKASKERRVKAKHERGQIKRLRRARPQDD